MGFLADRKILITGVLSTRSIAYGIAKACQREGATLAFTYANDDLKDRVAKIAAEFGPCPGAAAATSRPTTRSRRCSTRCVANGTALDGLLHSIAFAPREALAGDFLTRMSRDAFAIAHDISSYSFAALAKGARPLMPGRNASLLTLTYLGAVRALAELQRDGSGEGEPRGERPLSRRGARSGRHARQRDLGRARSRRSPPRASADSRRSWASSSRRRRCAAT